MVTPRQVAIRSLALLQGLFLAGALAAGEDAPAVRLTYLANAGFLVEAGERKVLIDALFGDGLDGYPVVPRELRRRLEAGEPPFDGVDLVLASHHHRDHFDPRAVAAFLRAVPDAIFLSTPPAVERLRALPDADDLRWRIQTADPTVDHPHRGTHNHVPVLALALHHGRDRSPPVPNLGLIVDLGGLRVLHVGDTEATAAEMRTAGLTRPVAVALVTSWSHAAVAEAIAADETVVMHLPTAEAPGYFFGSHGSYRARLDALQREAPAAHLALEPGTTLLPAPDP